ncbi:aminomethyl-transferring glycine dehydrogenase subunit GcvPB, partial [bacterium]|nr:aminomethyl-transferring glycine dehydrogenase subunit GcvPB [bacterium]
TMKYNPRVNEKVASLAGFANLHPLTDVANSQGALELIFTLQESLAEITGMERVSLQPAAGAHGEVTSLFMVSRYFKDLGQNRDTIIVPDSSHGTNPASASLAGFKVITIPSNSDGSVDLEALRSSMGPNIACLMLTNPSTLGLFEKNIQEICKILHDNGSLVYYDGANMNALMGIARPGDMGFDLMHTNLHKTFSTPHGGGGPGSGPVGARGKLADYLPGPIVVKEGDRFTFQDNLHTIGRVRLFWGSFSVIVKALAYIKALGAEGLLRASRLAVLAANYMRMRLKEVYHLPFDTMCMHEFVLSADKLKAEKGIHALDVAKGLLDKGFHAPTIYFPLIVEEALMIEPTETESLETMDSFIEAMIKLVEEEGETLHDCPQTLPVSRLDETKAARHPVLCWPENVE